jgi:hypothetical protein
LYAFVIKMRRFLVFILYHLYRHVQD